MAVVTIHSPGSQHALHITIVSGASNMIHNLVASPLNKRLPDFRGKGIQHLIPCHAFPPALAALARTLQGIENAFGIVDLVDGRRAFGTVTPATARMVGITFQLLDTPALFVYVGQQPTGRLTVEADGRDDLVMPLDFARPRLRVVLHPVAPALRRWAGGQVAYRHRLAAGSDLLFQGNIGHLISPSFSKRR